MMATYNEIQNWICEKHNWVLKACWIAHCKELEGLKPDKTWNRQGNGRVYPCLDDKREVIIDAFQHFGMIKD